MDRSGIDCFISARGVKIRSFIHGGAQERKRRAGTENVPSIVGLGKAVEMAVADMEERTSKEINLRDRMIDAIYKRIPYARLNGDRTRRLPNNVNFSFQFVEGESMLIMIWHIFITSSGSALYIRFPGIHPMSFQHDWVCLMRLHGSLRLLPLGYDNTQEEIARCCR